MENPLFQPTITRKLYSTRSVFLGTFLGGPLVGGYLLAENFKLLEQPANASKTWLFTILAFILIFVSAFIPFLDQLPGFVYSFVFCLIAHGVARKFQGSQLDLHQANGGGFYSDWRAVAIGFCCLVIMVALIFGLLYLADLSTN